ncbi:MAG: hypothetical protein AAFQ92_19165 [Bacteroidota bacterium]
MANIRKREQARQLEDTYDRIRDYIINGVPLEPDELAIAKRAMMVYPIIVEEISTKAIIAKLIKLQISSSQYFAHKHIRETEHIYGKVRRADREGRKAILLEQMHEVLVLMIQDAKDSGNWAPVERMFGRIAKIEGLNDDQTSLVQVYQSLEFPKLEVTSDPQEVFVEIEEQNE